MVIFLVSWFKFKGESLYLQCVSMEHIHLLNSQTNYHSEKEFYEHQYYHWSKRFMRRLQNTVVLGCGRPVWEYREVCALFVHQVCADC